MAIFAIIYEIYGAIVQAISKWYREKEEAK